MGLFQQAYNTYEAHAKDIGKIIESQEPICPVAHIIARAQIEITVNEKGEFVSASALDKKSEKIIIPVTEESAGRTSAPCPHPLAEQMAYLVPYNSMKLKLYLNQLSEWKNSEYTNIKLDPIFQYVAGGTIIGDLEKANVIEKETNGKLKDEKSLVRWIVIGVGEQSGPCWTDQSLLRDYTNFYQSKIKNNPNELCMISGKTTVPAKQHPKGVIAINGNAKLISANDKSGFTYRGRFDQDWQAATIGYESSQKAHNALRWLAANQGVIIGGRTFLCWNPEGIKVPSPIKPLFSIQKKNNDIKHINYRKELFKTLNGWKEQLSKNAGSVTVITAFDAATTGRLSITYYSELLSSDFLNRLYVWDEHCQWFFSYQNIQQAPSLRQIIECAYGIEREEKGQSRLVVDDRVLKQQLQRLLSCRVDCVKFPRDIKERLVQRASEPMAYDFWNYKTVLSTACAVIKKYYYDYRKEIIEMALDPQKRDRSYQFGRLLAIMEKIERDTFSAIDEKRETNAMRLQSVFCREPMKYFRLLEEQMNKAYLPKLKPGQRGYYKKTIGQIVDMISQESELDWNKPLKDTYLIGYYLQRNELYTKNIKEEEKDESVEE